MRSYLAFAATLAVALSATCAVAAPFKCVGPDGKVVFSDQRCESDPVPAKPGTAGAPAADKARGPSPDQERLKALDAISTSHEANSEQKTAAMLEAGNIRRGLDGKLTAAERERREGLTKELAGADASQRAAALRELRTLYRD
jgi:hypothetical protein